MRNEVAFSKEELQEYFNKMQQQAMQQQAQMIAQSMQNNANQVPAI
jgi:hypothetical protein